jgi:Zn-finger nucleic acid-binding protein
MPRLEAHHACPACLGVLMTKLRLTPQPGAPVVVDHCRRCGGLWLQAGKVQLLRRLEPAVLWEYVAGSTAAAPPMCHTCHVPLPRDAEQCGACGSENTLDCPECEREMRVETYEGVRLDVCRHCRGVWFDHHELDAIWRFELAAAVARRRAATGDNAAGDAATSHGALTVLDVLVWTPDLPAAAVYGAAHLGSAAAEAAGAAAGAAAEAAGAAARAAGQAPEIAAAAAEAATEAAAGVFETVVEIIAGIFS